MSKNSYSICNFLSLMYSSSAGTNLGPASCTAVDCKNSEGLKIATICRHINRETSDTGSDPNTHGIHFFQPLSIQISPPSFWLKPSRPSLPTQPNKSTMTTHQFNYGTSQSKSWKHIKSTLTDLLVHHNPSLLHVCRSALTPHTQRTSLPLTQQRGSKGGVERNDVCRDPAFFHTPSQDNW